MHTDLPLKDNSTDKLGRNAFAYEIASGLVKSFEDNNESIVLGINGTWGSGKSTLLNFIINEIEQLSSDINQEIIILRFNPWMFSGQKELQTVFLRELILKLKNNSEKLKNASKKIAEFLEYLNWIKFVDSGTGEILKTLKNFFKKVGKEKELGELKSEIDDILISSKVKLYITIDDIDRLTPPEITDIFQLIKLNGNFANTIFILAYDQNVVETALENQFGENGKRYIQKIVQVDYTLPSISKEDISRLFVDNLNQLFNNEEITNNIKSLNSSIKNEPFMGFFSSLRDIYRFNNSIKLRLPSIVHELNILDFFLIESLRVFDHKAYKFIIDNKERLIYRSEHNINNLSSPTNNEKSTEAFIESLDFEQLIKKILRRLFIIDTAYGLNVDSTEDLILGKRVADKSYFNRYFNLQLSNFDIQEDIFENFIDNNSVTKNEEILKEIHAKGQLPQFLNWIKIKSKDSDENRLQNIIQSILTYSKNLPYQSEMFLQIGSDLTIVLHYISEMLYRFKDIEPRRKIIFKHLENNYLFSSFYLTDRIIYAKKQLGEGKLYSKSEWYCLFKFENDDDTRFIKKIIVERNTIAKQLFDRILSERDFLAEDEIGLVLNTVYQNYKEHYEENFPKLIEENSELIKYLWLSIKRSWRTYGNKIGFQLADYQFYPCLNKEDIKDRIDDFNLDDFDENENKVIAIFLRAYKDGFQEKKYYDLEAVHEIENW